MKTRAIATAVLLGGCIALLQYHAIQFWLAHTGPMGAVWSLLLEGAALWLWSHRMVSRRALGALVTILLLAGPLYQVSAPLIEEAQRTGNTTTASAARSAAIESEIHTLDRALATYLANSATRQGWVGRIDHTQARIEQLRGEQAALIAAGIEPSRMPWQRAAVIGMEALAIVIFQLVAVMCIGELRENHFAGAGKMIHQPAATRNGAVATSNAAPLRAPNLFGSSPACRPPHRKAANFAPATAKPAARAVA